MNTYACGWLQVQNVAARSRDAQPKSSANLADELQALMSRLSDPAKDFVQ